MDPVTHAAAGVAIARLIPTPARKWGLLAGVAFALVPDVDFLLVLVDRLAFIRHHRGITHSLVALAAFAVLGAGAGRLLGGRRWFRPLLLLGLAVLASHLLLDVATSYGTQLLSPFSRHKFALDWLFIIDPYFTLILLAGAFGAWVAPARERLLAALSLGLAAVYLLLGGLYHYQALALGHRIFTGPESAGLRVAALPQPFSLRRWHLLGAGPTEVQQTLVRLPLWSFLEPPKEVIVADLSRVPKANPRIPPLPYRPPQNLVVHKWPAPSLPVWDYAPDAKGLLQTFLEFARFPILARWEVHRDKLFLKMLDLRFAIPGRAFPYVLELTLAKDGRLLDWRLGRLGILDKTASPGP